MRKLLISLTMIVLLAMPLNAVDELENGEYTTELNGFKIFYLIRGNGPVCMVMPMSWGISHEGLAWSFKTLEEFLTMVYFDPRGMGRSEDIRTEADMSMAAVREDLDALRRHLGLERVILIGWSNGGMNAIKYASSHPEEVSHLIIVHSVAYFSPEDNQRLSEEYPELSKAIGELIQAGLSEEEKDADFRKLFRETWFPLMFYDFEAHKDWFYNFVDSADLSWKHLLYSQQVDSPVFDAREDLKAISAKTLVVAGGHDMLPPEYVQEIHKGIENSTFVVFERSGHFAFVEEQAAFVQVVRKFLGLN